MTSLSHNLQSGRPGWLVELLLRAVGLALLAGAWHLGRLAHRWIVTPVPHPATLAEFTICALAFVLLSAGLALSLVGAGLFRLVPIPKQRVVSRSGMV